MAADNGDNQSVYCRGNAGDQGRPILVLNAVGNDDDGFLQVIGLGLLVQRHVDRAL